MRRRAWSPRWRARRRCRARPSRPQTQSLTRQVRRPTATTCLRRMLGQTAARVLWQQRSGRLQGRRGPTVVWDKRGLAHRVGRLRSGMWGYHQSL